MFFKKMVCKQKPSQECEVNEGFKLFPWWGSVLFQINEVQEMSLSANQLKSKMKQMSWKVEGDGKTEATPVRGGPIHHSALVVELGPMEIRTFILKF